MFRTTLALIALLGLFLIGPSRSYAACKWVWDCSSGECRHKPVCESPIDIVPPEPPDLPPIAPMRPVKPIEPPTLPPLGTRMCQQRYICEGGQCAWRQVCQ